MEKSLLLKLGLNEEEIQIYLSLIKSGVQTIKQVADVTHVNRTSAYRYLDSLSRKGLIEWVIDERGKKVKATSPENLALIIRNQKTQLNQLEVELPQLINQLHLQKSSEKFNTQIRYYQGKKGIQQLFWNVLRSSETTRSYAPLRRREFIDPSYEEELEKEWVARNLKDRVITNEDRMEYVNKNFTGNYKETLDIRIIPKKKFYISNDIIIYDNVMAIASFEKDNLVGVEIENSEIAKTQKSIFDIVWQTASPIKI